MKESKRKTIPDLCSSGTKHMMTMRCGFTGGDLKSSIIRRRTWRLRRDIDLDKWGVSHT